MVYPENLNWSNNNVGVPIVILNSGTKLDVGTNDWPDAMKWLKENTSKDDVIASWWDYGYWISTLSERKTLADNSTLLDWQIGKIARVFMSSPDNAWKILVTDSRTNVAPYFVTLPDAAKYTPKIIQEQKLEAFEQWNTSKTLSEKKKFCEMAVSGVSCEPYDPEIAKNYSTLFDYWEAEIWQYPPVLTGLDADYIVINIAAKKLSDDNVLDLYTIEQKGADETKAFWFMKIAGLPILDYYQGDLQSYTNKFWDETLLGQLMPFTPVLYVDPNNPEMQTETYRPGYLAIYVKDPKFPIDGNGPFQLVYVSPSFEMDKAGPLTGPLIYKINKNYNLNQ
jgi:dolichyl-diphosphooligosaccharide--protein glycosyltransferase